MAVKKAASAKRAAQDAVQDRGMVQRLKDQRTVYRKAQEIHENPRTLKELAFYPAHDKRLETPEYKKAHDHLTKALDLPCLVCGVRNSTLKDKAQNPYGARQMETHHHLVEWSLANAIDPGKFNRIVLPHLKARHPHNPLYAKKALTAEDIAGWVDHSEDNLWVLCDVHHRAPYLGIHEITYPIWCPMDLLLDDFETYVRQQIAEQKATGRNTAGKVGAGTKKKAKRKAR